MIRQRATVRVLCGLILCGWMAGCSDSASPTGPTGGPQSPSAPQVVEFTFTLGLGDSAAVPGGKLEVAFRRVVKDERCPGDASCVAGVITQAVLEFEVTRRVDGGLTIQSPIQLSTQTTKSARIDNYTVSLDALAPYPFASQPPIKSEDWRANVRITSTQN